MKNEMEVWLTARAENEGLARMLVASFLMEIDPTIEQLADVKTAVSEAFTNSVIHGYGLGEETLKSNEGCKVRMYCEQAEELLTVVIEDFGCGIKDIKQAMEPLYTSRPDMERSGMGFSFMEAFMDEVEVESTVGAGTKVTMRKNMRKNEEDNNNIDEE